MPVCRDCLKQQPTCELRRAPRGPKCKDALACARRRDDTETVERLLRRHARAAA